MEVSDSGRHYNYSGERKLCRSEGSQAMSAGPSGRVSLEQGRAFGCEQGVVVGE